MTAPNYIKELIKKRADYTQKVIEIDCQLSDWLDKQDKDTLNDLYSNNLACPNCGEIIHEICLTSNPPLYQIMPCASCGFSYNYPDRFIPYNPVTQYELNDYFLRTHTSIIF